MNILVFDTETVDLAKPYCYNVGYVIYDTETAKTILKREFILREVWENDMLFSMAHFAYKRPIYETRIAQGKITICSWGDFMNAFYADLIRGQVKIAYAYNAPFDIHVFEFNANYFNTSNPFATLKVLDIIPFVHRKIGFTKAYQDFCERNELFTDTGNYSATAENVVRFLMDSLDFEEEHTALSDSIIELQILRECVRRGCEWTGDYKKYASIPRKAPKVLNIEIKNSPEDIEHIDIEYRSIRFFREDSKIILKNY